MRNDLFARYMYTPATNPFLNAQACSTELTEFKSMTDDQVKGLIDSCCLNTWTLDPLPALIMKGCVDILLPLLTKIINMPIESVTVLVQLKEAMIRPELKKDSLDGPRGVCQLKAHL